MTGFKLLMGSAEVIANHLEVTPVANPIRKLVRSGNKSHQRLIVETRRV